MSEPRSAPKWREDFPFESEDDEIITRRDATRFLVVVSGGLCVGTGLVAAASRRASVEVTARLDLGPAGDLAPGTSRAFHYPDERTPAILVRRASGELAAFARACPHLACPVTYEAAGQEGGERLACHCHNGRFDLGTGKGTSGPPRELRPLRRIELSIEGDHIIALGYAPLAGA